MGMHFQKNSEFAANSKHFPSSFWKKLNVFLCNFFAIKWEFDKMGMFFRISCYFGAKWEPILSRAYCRHTAKIWEFPGYGTQICFSTWGPPHPGGVYLAPLASNIPFFAGAFGAYYPSPMPCYILYFPDSGWVFSCKIVSFICFGWLLGHLWTFSSVCFYPVSGWVFSCKIVSFICFGWLLWCLLLIGVFLSIIFEFLVEFSHAKSCTNHYVRVLFFHEQFHCRFLTLNTTARKKWLNDAHRSRFVLGTHCWGALFPLGKSFIFS